MKAEMRGLNFDIDTEPFGCSVGQWRIQVIANHGCYFLPVSLRSKILI